MEGDRRRRGAPAVENVERPSRVRQRRTRDSGALSEPQASGKARAARFERRAADRRRHRHH
jgi:hypothetical protein